MNLLALVLVCWFQQPASDLATLQSRIESLVSQRPGTYGVAFHHVQRNETLLINAEDRMHAASTMKVPVMMRLYEMAAAGDLDLDQPVPVLNQFKSIVDGSAYSITVDSEESLYNHIGQSVPMRQLINAMIVHSSNLATNILIQRADPTAIRELMQRIDADHMLVRRGVEDIKAFDAGLNNESDARSIMQVMLALTNNDYFTSAHRQEMIAILRDQAFTDIIPAGIPQGSQATVANKTGSISYIQHDAAIVDLASGDRYVLVIYARHFGDAREQVKQTGRDISRMVYSYVAKRAVP